MVYFLSDAHLGADAPERESQKRRALRSFLRDEPQPGDTLYIVGDLFDFWFEYRRAIPGDHVPVLGALYDCTERGVRVVYIAGNHDFWAGDLIRHGLGLEFHDEPLHETIAGWRFLIHHGDGLRARERGYRLWKRIYRHPLSVWLYRLLHPDLGIPLALCISRSSRERSSHALAPEAREEYLAFARARFADGVDCIVVGHTHQPDLTRIDSKVFVNLGDWITHFTYAVFDGSDITLKRWDAPGS